VLLQHFIFLTLSLLIKSLAIPLKVIAICGILDTISSDAYIPAQQSCVKLDIVLSTCTETENVFAFNLFYTYHEEENLFFHLVHFGTFNTTERKVF